MDNLSLKMKRDWNERAERDPFHYVLNRHGIGEWNTEEFYQTGKWDIERFLLPFLAQFDVSPTRRSCLELGCGAGRHTAHLAELFGSVVALDVSEEMVAVAQKNVAASNVEFVAGNGTDLDVLDDSSVSFAFSLIVFQHIPSQDAQLALLKEVARVLKRRGWFLLHLFTDAKHAHLMKINWEEREQSGDLHGWSEPARYELEDGRWQTHTRTAVSKEAVRATLEEAGLKLLYDEEFEPGQWLIGGQKS